MSSPESSEAADLRQDARRALPFAALSGLLQILFSLLGMVLLVRYLPQEQYGVWAIIVGLSVPILLIVSLGHVQALYRFMPAIDDPEARRQLLWRVIARRLAVAVAAFALLVLAFPLYAERFGLAGHWDLLLWMLPGHLCQAANQYVMAALNVAFRQREVLIGAFVCQLVFVAAVAVGIARQEEILYFAAVYSGSGAIQLAIGLAACLYFYGRPQAGDLVRRALEDPERRRYRRTCFVDDLGTAFLSPDINRLVLAALSSSAEVAVFAVASNIVERLRRFLPVEVFRPLAMVSIFRRYEETGEIGDVNRIFRLLYALNRTVSFLYLALFLPLGAPLLAWVFREEYAAAWLPAVFLFLAIGLIGMPIGIVAQTLRRPQALVWAKLAVLVNLGLGIPLAARHGAAGIAAAAMIAAACRNLITYLLLRREFGVRYPWSTLLRFLAAGATVTLGVDRLDSLVGLIPAAALGGVAWLVALRLFRVIEPADRELLASLVPERLARPLRWVLGG